MGTGSLAHFRRDAGQTWEHILLAVGDPFDNIIPRPLGCDGDPVERVLHRSQTYLLTRLRAARFAERMSVSLLFVSITVNSPHYTLLPN